MALAESDQDFTITRTFQAPRALVWKAWTEAEHLAKWWGPKGCTITIKKLEFRPGGVFHYSMTVPNGMFLWGKFVYGEITAPERLSFINSFSDENEGLTRNPWTPVWPLEVNNVITLTESGGETTLELRGGPINATDEERAAYAAARESMRGGFGGSFDQLDAHLAELQR